MSTRFEYEPCAVTSSRSICSCGPAASAPGGFGWSDMAFVYTTAVLGRVIAIDLGARRIDGDDTAQDRRSVYKSHVRPAETARRRRRGPAAANRPRRGHGAGLVLEPRAHQPQRQRVRARLRLSATGRAARPGSQPRDLVAAPHEATPARARVQPAALRGALRQDRRAGPHADG